MNCPRCGKQIPENAAFCDNCGYMIFKEPCVSPSGSVYTNNGNYSYTVQPDSSVVIECNVSVPINISEFDITYGDDVLTKADVAGLDLNAVG